jgi:outer membrane protein assembly factor BamB
MKRIFRRLFRVAALVILTAVVAFGVLKYGFGMRLEFDGGMKPRMSFGQGSKHFDVLEKSRAQQAAQPVPMVAIARSESTAAPAASVEAPKWENYWTDFLGPNREGRYDQMPILTSWPASGLAQQWKQPVGGGYASFSVADGRAYTIEQRRANEAVTAYDVLTGRELWAHTYPAQFEEPLGGPGPRATPVYHDGWLYSLGATGELLCLNASSGKVKWSKNILTDNSTKNIQWAMSASPLIVDDKVIVLPGGADGKSVVAYNRLTGERMWSSMNDRATYASPVLVTLAGRLQIVVVTAENIAGLGVDDGQVIWTFPWSVQNEISCARPLVVGDNRVFVSSGYGKGSVVLEIAKAEAGFTARPVWQNTRMKNKFNHSVTKDGYIYGLDESILACVDANTGDLKWKGGRYGYGQLLLAGDHLVVLTEEGEVVLVEATPEAHREKAHFKAIEGKTWNIPAIDHGMLLVRNANEMACFRIGKR